MTSPPPDLQGFIRLQRLYRASRVFHTWTDPKSLEQWFRPFGLPIW
ncbi:MAG: hypothetical protein ABI947_27655 [Chloroflexota bacterium]